MRNVYAGEEYKINKEVSSKKKLFLVTDPEKEIDYWVLRYVALPRTVNTPEESAAVFDGQLSRKEWASQLSSGKYTWVLMYDTSEKMEAQYGDMLSEALQARHLYTYTKKTKSLTVVEDTLVDYLCRLLDQDCTILIAAKDDAGYGLTEQEQVLLRCLGAGLQVKGQYRAAYCAVLANGASLAEDLSPDRLDAEGELPGGHHYEMSSAGFETGNIGSIRIDGVEYSKNLRGLNIVVYDNVSQQVVDSVNFDTHQVGEPAKR